MCEDPYIQKPCWGKNVHWVAASYIANGCICSRILQRISIRFQVKSPINWKRNKSTKEDANPSFANGMIFYRKTFRKPRLFPCPYKSLEQSLRIHFEIPSQACRPAQLQFLTQMCQAWRSKGSVGLNRTRDHFQIWKMCNPPRLSMRLSMHAVSVAFKFWTNWYPAPPTILRWWHQAWRLRLVHIDYAEGCIYAQHASPILSVPLGKASKVYSHKAQLDHLACAIRFSHLKTETQRKRCMAPLSFRPMRAVTPPIIDNEQTKQSHPPQ